MTIDLRDPALEQDLIGCMVASTEVCGAMLRRLEPGDLTSPEARTLFAAITRAYEAGRPTDSLGVVCELRRSGELASELGAWLFAAEANCAMPIAAPKRAEELRRLSRLRRLQRSGLDIAAFATEPGDVDEKIARAEASLADLEAHTDAVYSAAEVADAALELMDAMASGNPPGVVKTGIAQLDREFGGGLWPGHLVLVGARPSVGKSALAVNIAHSALRRGVGVLFASLEMSAAEVGWRMALDVGGSKDLGVMVRSAGEVSQWPLRILTAPITTAAIRAEARRMKPEGLGLVVVDYIQLLTGSGRDNRALEVGEYARSLKILARELEVPVLALAQLNREVEQRHDGKPRLSDLRDSGELEQHADEVILLHRERTSRDAELIIAKQRNGPTSRFKLLYIPEFMRFASPAYPAESSVA